MTCIYSTLRYISSHARCHKVTPIVTFDQPLWLKAVTLQECAPPDSDVDTIVVWLGAFHTMMSFLGATGHIMAGSGLEELLECIYVSTSVSHMLSGKAISRTIHVHILVSSALNIMLSSQAFGITVNVSGSMVFNGKKEDFLSNKKNKRRFIMLLRDHLERQRCHTDQARSDADLLIVHCSSRKPGG